MVLELSGLHCLPVAEERSSYNDCDDGGGADDEEEDDEGQHGEDGCTHGTGSDDDGDQ